MSRSRPGEGALICLAPGDTGQARHVACEGHGGQRPLADNDRVHELDGDVLRIGGLRARAEHQQRPAGLEAARHGQTRLRDTAGLRLEEAGGNLDAPLEPAVHQRTASIGQEEICVSRRRGHSIRLSAMSLSSCS